MSFDIYKKTTEIDKKTKLGQRPLVFIDLETTGLDPLKHEIIEICCLVVDQKTLEVKKEYYRQVQPEHPEMADPVALKLNKFSPQAWKKAKKLEQVIDELNSLAPGGMFVGYGVSFDRLFLEKAVREKGKTLNFDHHWLDVTSLVYFSLLSENKLERLGLTYVCEVLGIPHEGAHTATGDVKATLAVYRYLQADFLFNRKNC